MNRILIMCAVLTFSSAAWADAEEDILAISHAWEHIKYEVPAKEQGAEFEKLAKVSEKLTVQYPQRADAATWHGIVVASEAGAKGGLGALSLAKAARLSFEQAIVIDPNVLDGAAYTSLGSLYYQVPGWPLGFGDDKKALELLQKGLAVSPNGIDANFFYGDYLFRKGDYAQAEQALRKALQAPSREGRKLADEGRRKEASELLDKVRDKKR